MKCLKSLAVVGLACLSGNFIARAGDLPALTASATAPVAAAQTAALPAITANGVMTLLGKKQVLFRTTGPAQSDASSYVLEVGESQSGIKVVSVDDDSKTVTFDNHGTIQKVALQTATLVSAPVPVQTPIMTLQSEPLRPLVPAPPAEHSNELPVEPAEPLQNNAGNPIVTIGRRPAATATRFKHQLGLAPQDNQNQAGGIGFAPPLPVNGTPAIPVTAPTEAPPPAMYQAIRPPGDGAISGGPGAMMPSPPH